MTKKSRYFLLIICTVLFLIIAPFLVLYVRGVNFDWQTKQFTKTGILSVRSEPSEVQILVDDKLVKENEGDIKFLTPGEHSLSLAKPGFQTWTKRFEVLAGQVTWANMVGKEILLFNETPAEKNISQSVTDYSLMESALLYISDQRLNIVGLDFPHAQKYYELDGSAYGIVMAPQNSGVWLKKIRADGQTSLSIYNAGNNTFNDLNIPWSPNARLVFGPQTKPLVLDQKSLFSFEFEPPNKTALAESVLDMAYYDGFYYTLQSSPTSTALKVGQGFNSLETAFEMPRALTGRIFVNFNKEVFILLDENLYKLDSELSKLAEGVKNVVLAQDKKSLWVVYGSELGLISAGSENIYLVARSNFPLENTVVNESYGAAFYQKNNGVYAAELDLRDRQNEFLLYESPTLKKFSVSQDAKTLWVLDGETLKELKIR